MNSMVEAQKGSDIVEELPQQNPKENVYLKKPMKKYNCFTELKAEII